MVRFIFLTLFGFSLLANSAGASTQCKAYLGSQLGARYKLEIGQVLEIEIIKNGRAERQIVSFLGKARHIDGSISGAFFFNAEKMRIEFIGIEHIQFFERTNLIDLDEVAPIVRSINQQGGTCAAYAIFNCFRQLYEDGYLGNGMLAHHLGDEASRNRFFVRINSDYYSDGNHRGVEDDVARELGFEIQRLDTRNAQSLADHLRRLSSNPWPVLLYFDVNSSMSETPYIIYNHMTDSVADKRLWQPRPSGNSSPGGHQILVIKTFVDTKGKEWLLVVDSNWQAPRLWDIQALRHIHAARIGGWSLWQNGSNPEELPPPPPAHFSAGEPLQDPTEF